MSGSFVSEETCLLAKLIRSGGLSGSVLQAPLGSYFRFASRSLYSSALISPRA
jgi:hypothetical protein